MPRCAALRTKWRRTVKGKRASNKGFGRSAAKTHKRNRRGGGRL